MIENLFEKALAQAKKYKIDDSKNLTVKELRHWCASTFWSYCLAYGLLENIMFAVRKGECTDVKEVEEFIEKRINQTAVEPRVPIMLESEY